MIGAVESSQKVRGELVWFNETEDHGVLQTEDGERIEFRGDAFAGERPQGRVGGLLVEFMREPFGNGAAQIRIVEAGAVRRARRRGR